MKLPVSKNPVLIYPLVTEIEDQTMLKIYDVVFSSKNPIKDINALRNKLKDKRFFEKFFLLLTGIKIEEELAEQLWDEIAKYHNYLTSSLGRPIHITATIAEYFLNVKRYLKNPSVMDLILTEKIKDKIIQDILTGMYKGHLFEKFVTRELNRSKRHGHKFSLLVLQINGLESATISGHTSVALQTVISVASIINSSKRAEDEAFRFSMSKFGMILPHTDKKGALLFANRLLHRINEEVLSISGVVFGLTLSIGIQTYPDDGEDAKTLISNVEKACYKSKLVGPNQIVYQL
jgi:diguanylate cyclase (GGDEF)-like protein